MLDNDLRQYDPQHLFKARNAISKREVDARHIGRNR